MAVKLIKSCKDHGTIATIKIITGQLNCELLMDAPIAGGKGVVFNLGSKGELGLGINLRETK